MKKRQRIYSPYEKVTYYRSRRYDKSLSVTQRNRAHGYVLGHKLRKKAVSEGLTAEDEKILKLDKNAFDGHMDLLLVDSAFVPINSSPLKTHSSPSPK